MPRRRLDLVLGRRAGPRGFAAAGLDAPRLAGLLPPAGARPATDDGDRRPFRLPKGQTDMATAQRRERARQYRLRRDVTVDRAPLGGVPGWVGFLAFLQSGWW